MQRVVLYLIVFIIVFIAWPFMSFAQLNHNLHVTAEEVFIRFYPSVQYAQIIEYHLVSTRSSKQERSADIRTIKDLVQQAEYCDRKFQFTHFQSIEESLNREKGFVKVECNLLTSQSDLRSLMQDLCAHVLDRDVNVEIQENQIFASFVGDDLGIVVYDPVKAYSKERQRVIVWPKKEAEFYEAVFNHPVDEHYPIFADFESNLSSPSISEEEIRKIRHASPPLTGAEADFQNDADIYRLRHLQYYGGLLEEYFQALGKYPFQEEADVPIYVHIAQDKQIEYTKQPIPHPHKIFDMKRFVDTLEAGLGRTIEEYYDPQFVPVKKPNFYLYMISQDTYFLAVQVSQYFDFAFKVSDNYYKVEVSNNPPTRDFITYQELLAHAEFIRAIQSKPKRSAEFEKREKTYLHYTKTLK